MNTTARIESTGEGNRIHLSQDTADQLIAANKSHWVKTRDEKVSAKGKGLMTTFWLNTKFKAGPASSSGGGASSERHTIDFGSASGADGDLLDIAKTDTNAQETKISAFNAKIERLVNWNVNIMVRTLKLIVARRASCNSHGNGEERSDRNSLTLASPAQHRKTVIDEVQEIIHMPVFDASATKDQSDPNTIKLDSDVLAQLRQYVQVTATMYQNNNPFHNFEHASHVTMSVFKLLNRIVAPDGLDEKKLTDADDVQITLHDHTYGITSDPLTQFACLFSVLIHDVDHCGVPNSQLVKENSNLTRVYNNQSVLEQNSVDVAWNLLMTDSFSALHNAICPTPQEMSRFRSLVVNSVMATDIVDKKLKKLRNARWEKAFTSSSVEAGSSTATSNNSKDDIDRTATIVIEHLIQASDVSHTMHVRKEDCNDRFAPKVLVAGFFPHTFSPLLHIHDRFCVACFSTGTCFESGTSSSLKKGTARTSWVAPTRTRPSFGTRARCKRNGHC
jgi:3'5'-cyclic nucleotide phosphodiesterase/Adenylate and Guanylate cyclase catalytic domain